jgi:ketosteroid isomerase-like protein
MSISPPQIFSVVVAVAIMGLVVGPAQASALRDARGFADEFNQAQMACDLKRLDEMTADDLVYVTGAGALAGKAQFLAAYASPCLTLEPLVIATPTYRRLGDGAAIVGGEVVLQGTGESKSFHSHFRFADTFVWSEGRWQVVHIQVTKIPAASN